MTTVVAAVTAYRRTEYIGEALRSIDRQTSPPDRVVVASDFRPVDGIRNGDWIRVTGAPQGPRVAEIARRTEGYDVIAFLDDDDTWEPGKIAAVRSAFDSDRVSFFNRAHAEFFDGVPAKRPLWKILRDFRGGFTRVDGIQYYGNSSCMAVRRSAIVPYLSVLDAMDLAIDDALFWLSTTTGAVVTSALPLSRLRIHAANSSRAADAPARRTLAGRRLVTYRILDGCVGGRYRAEFVSKFREIASAYERAAREAAR